MNKTMSDEKGFEGRLEELKRLTYIIYILQAIGLFVVVTYIAATVIIYIKRDEVKGTWLDSHFKWQLRTFWISIIAAAIGFITMIVLIGFVILFADGVWVIYRVVKGWLNLSEGKEMYA